MQMEKNATIPAMTAYTKTTAFAMINHLQLYHDHRLQLYSIEQAPRALAWWLGLMAPNEDVVGSIPHAGVVLTTVVHPTMVGGPRILLYG